MCVCVCVSVCWYTQQTIHNTSAQYVHKNKFSNIFSPGLRPPSLLLIGYRRSFQGLKRPGRQTSPSPPSSAEVKNQWRYTSCSTQYNFQGIHRVSFTFSPQRIRPQIPKHRYLPL